MTDASALGWWGVPLAINAGDGMFTLAFAAIQRLAGRGVPAVEPGAGAHVGARGGKGREVTMPWC